MKRTFQEGTPARHGGSRLAVLAMLASLATIWHAEGAKPPPSVHESAAEPIKYVGAEQPDKRFYDGALRHAVGVHLYQALRANRTVPPEGGLIGWTYNHQSYLAYWHDQFYLQWLWDPLESTCRHASLSIL